MIIVRVSGIATLCGSGRRHASWSRDADEQPPCAGIIRQQAAGVSSPAASPRAAGGRAMKFPLFPDQASTTAAQVDHLYFFLTAVSAVRSGAGLRADALFPVQVSARTKADRTPLAISTMKIEITWTVIPLLLCHGHVRLGRACLLRHGAAASGRDGDQRRRQAMDVEDPAPGGQPRDQRTAVPVGRIVKLTLASQDVIHSFFIPAFRIKQDVVPGRLYDANGSRPTRVGPVSICSAPSTAARIIRT